MKKRVNPNPDIVFVDENGDRVEPVPEFERAIDHLRADGRTLKLCPKCGNYTEQLVTNVLDASEGCFACVAGPDQRTLRRVTLWTENGVEVHLVHTLNNLEAFKFFYRPGVLQMTATPLYN